ncbi:MAG TPA: NAD(P)H-quinone oxidoreductase [Gemmatimonadaceae bacterium]|jgi:putative PIG3 family NAD(P)H quinone oxidoreductase
MKAAVITKPGGPDVLAIEERPVPVPQRGQILVRVHASALNRADLLQREGHYPAPPGWPADIPGMEFAGEVAQLGDGVSRWRAGDRVFGIVGGGGNAEFLTTDAESVAQIPDRLSWTEAAAVPEAFITAYDALVTQAGVATGETVLIHAVGSGVGLATTQVARAWRAIPYGTARTADKIERARAYGLEEGIVVGDDVDVIGRVMGGRSVDVTIDLVGGAYLPASIRVAAPHGRIMLVGTMAGREATLPLGLILGKRLTLRGTILRARSLEEKRAVTAAFERDVVPLFASGVLRATVDSTFDLADIRDAHTKLGGNKTFGKIVLRVV